ncbi:hypothetical protein HMPREF9522_02444 [Enterococcus faecium TX0082]|nr:hypothetical protein HMPREF9522_02444 [Enterococcus faecium TX0082]
MIICSFFPLSTNTTIREPLFFEKTRKKHKNIYPSLNRKSFYEKQKND